MPSRLACIVEGQGDVEAVPVLIRRIVQEVCPDRGVTIPSPLRIPRSKLVKPGELERAVELSARRAGLGGAILVLLDSDDECPAELGPDLLARASRQRPDMSIRVVLAKCEFEAWLLAGAESLRGRRGLPEDLRSPDHPEVIRGAKEWLTARMTGDRHYVETLDQAALAAVLDLAVVRRRADSFDKFFRDVSSLLT